MDPVPALHDTSIGVLCIDTSPLCDAPTLVESVASTSWIQTEQRSIPVAVQNRSSSVALPSALMAPAAYHDHAGDKSADDGLWHACGVCHTKETPQWRTGPDGPGTLCNACGIRYRMAGDRHLAEHSHRRVPTTGASAGKSRGAAGRVVTLDEEASVQLAPKAGEVSGH
jgi:hypothetical protein